VVDKVELLFEEASFFGGRTMPTRLYSVVIDTPDPSATAAWWAAALGWTSSDWTPSESSVYPTDIEQDTGRAIPLVPVLVRDLKTGLNRLHVDLPSTSPADQAAKVSALEAAGAVRIDIGQGDTPWVVLAAPDGDEFCVLEPRETYARTGPIAAVVAKARDPRSLAAFWVEASGWELVHASDVACGLLDPRGGGDGPFLEFIKDDSPKVGKNRWHLDIAPFEGDDHLAEVARLESLGATRIEVGQSLDPPDQITWVVLADPEGNEFCVLSSR
jgi:predicted enzyme related to lactoylglutathione lyase